ncbi:DUF6268 family outer membrane beta-barrel protein [Parabacteroides gordonii]|jgi:two-component system LytT family response regulator|uniref:LytR/AlgR family response regulator transcription factor n=1 Tax=Parabacteroides gordonii TaxID=574930 RepID=UPI00241EE57D|nr:DUF6268 family outer membrane beta-barrel protein [Parabacteroides gordonii]
MKTGWLMLILLVVFVFQGANAQVWLKAEYIGSSGFRDVDNKKVDGKGDMKVIQGGVNIPVSMKAEYALDSYEVDAIDYLVKPIEIERFKRAVVKANVYHTLLKTDNSKNLVESVAADHIFVKAERRYFKIQFRNILFIEGLKDYVVIQTPDQRIVTKMNLKSIHEMLPKDIFLRTNKSYIVNTDYIDSFDNNDVFIGKYEISIGNSYRDAFFDTFFMKNNPAD